MILQNNHSLSLLNTFRIQARAKHFIEIGKEQELLDLLAQPEINHVSKMLLGGGSNVLFTQDYEGLVISNCIRGISVVQENKNEVVVEIGAGEVWHDFVMYALEKGWGGIENLSLIPGKIGAAPIQNIGAYGVELKDVFAYLDFIELDSGTKHRFRAADCKFGYRNSVFKQALKGKTAITKVTLNLRKKDYVLNCSYGAINQELKVRCIAAPTIRDISDVVIAIRQSKLPDPAKIGNGGSFFKNPELSAEAFAALKAHFPEVPGYVVTDEVTKVPAGWLIDRAGWKGKRYGNYGVHVNQALVLVNYGGASGMEIYDLSSRILESVQEKYGVLLEREINVI